MKYKIRIKKTDESHDSNDVWYFRPGNPAPVGYAYQSKDDSKIHVVKCPECNTENYAMARVEGNCYSCGFNPNS